MRAGREDTSHASLLDVVALLVDVPADGLQRGDVGTIVEVLDPGHFLVEFADSDGQMYALPVLAADQLIVLHFQRRPALPV